MTYYTLSSSSEDGRTTVTLSFKTDMLVEVLERTKRFLQSGDFSYIKALVADCGDCEHSSEDV